MSNHSEYLKASKKDPVRLQVMFENEWVITFMGNWELQSSNKLESVAKRKYTFNLKTLIMHTIY